MQSLNFKLANLSLLLVFFSGPVLAGDCKKVTDYLNFIREARKEFKTVQKQLDHDSTSIPAEVFSTEVYSMLAPADVLSAIFKFDGIKINVFTRGPSFKPLVAKVLADHRYFLQKIKGTKFEGKITNYNLAVELERMGSSTSGIQKFDTVTIQQNANFRKILENPSHLAGWSEQEKSVAISGHELTHLMLTSAFDNFIDLRTQPLGLAFEEGLADLLPYFIFGNVGKLRNFKTLKFFDFADDTIKGLELTGNPEPHNVGMIFAYVIDQLLTKKGVVDYSKRIDTIYTMLNSNNFFQEFREICLKVNVSDEGFLIGDPQLKKTIILAINFIKQRI